MLASQLSSFVRGVEQPHRPVPASSSNAPGARDPRWRIAVLKIGGSVLTGPQAFRRVASFVAERLVEGAGERLVIVASAENGMTDALLATATGIVAEPDGPTMDLLWSTGETQA